MDMIPIFCATSPLSSTSTLTNSAHLLRNFAALVDVHLDKLGSSCKFFRDLIEHGRKHPAGAAPGRPEVTHDRLSFLDELYKLLALYFSNVL